MSIKIMTLVWESDITPAGKRLVLLAIADSANDQGVCWPARATLARKAGCDERTVKRVMADLESDGLVVRSYRTNRSTVYKINTTVLRERQLPPVPDDEGGQDVPPGDEVGDKMPPPGGQDAPRGGDTTPPRTVKEPSVEPTTPDAAAPEQQSLVPAVSGAEAQGRKTDERGKQPAAGANGLTINQVATRLAQAHYERLGKMGNVPAMMKIIRKAVERDFTPEQITAALEYLAENRWTLTEEKLANALRGGPQRPTRPAPGAANHSRDHLPETKRGVNQWGKPTHYSSGRAILYSSTGAEIQQ
jgi:hypothetical protein